MKLIDILETYNFRSYQPIYQSERDKENSTTIRIILDYNNWFEFGVNDWNENTETLKTIRKVLNKDILNSEVDYIKVEDLGILEIHLEVKQ